MEERTRIFEQQSDNMSVHTDPGGTPTSSVSESMRIGDESGEDAAPTKQSGIAMTTFNVINSIIGSGIIGIPYALSQAGLGIGILLLMIVGTASAFSMKTLIVGGSISNARSYQELVMVSYGRTGFIALTFMQACYPFLAMVSYNVIAGDTITKIVQRLGSTTIRHSVLAYRQFIIFLCSVLISLPLCLLKNIASLTKVSLASTATTLVVLLCLIIQAPSYTEKMVISNFPTSWTFANWKIPQALGIMSFAFMCQHNSFLCYHSLEDRSPQRWSKVVYLSVAFSFVLCTMFGVIGYATFKGSTQGDLLQNYCFTDDLINVARLLFCLTVLATFPIECFVFREVVENTLFVNQQPPTKQRHVILTCLIVFGTGAISMTTDCLGIILEINGVVNAAPLAFILPPLCVMRLQNEPFLKVKNLPYLATAAFGLLSAVVGTALIIFDVANGITCIHGKEPRYCLHGAATNFSRDSQGHGNFSDLLFQPL